MSVIQPGTLIRVKDHNRYHGQILKVLWEYTTNYYRVGYDTGVCCRATGMNRCDFDVITPEEAAGVNLLDQPFFKQAKDYFQVGDRVKVLCKRVSQYYAQDDPDRIVQGRVIRMSESAVNLWIPSMERFVELEFNDLERIEEHPENETDENGCVALGYDFFTLEPIFDEDNMTELFKGDQDDESPIGIVDTTETTDRWNFCEECGRAVTSIESDDYTTLCFACYERLEYTRCPDCGCIIHPDDMFEAGDGEYYCESCAAEHPGEDYDDDGDYGCFHSYGYDPSEFFFRDVDDKGNPVAVSQYDDPPTKLYMGVELEVDKGNHRGRCTRDLIDFGDELFYCKEDGSLDHGIEIVSHPCTLPYHLKFFPWQKIADTVKGYRYKSHDAVTCGLHVHVSRNALGKTERDQDLVAAKIMILMDKFWDRLVIFSRRDSAQLNEWAAKPNAKINRRDSVTSALRKSEATKRNTTRGARYHALNITNDHTLEFRLFRGTLEIRTLKASLELVSNIVGLAMKLDLVGVQDATWKDIVKFQQFDELDAYVASKGLDNYNDKPLGNVEPEKDPDPEEGDHVLCKICSDSFTGTVSARLQDDVYLVFDDNNDDHFRIAFTNELTII